MVGQWTCNLEVLGSWVAGGARGEGRRSGLMNWENTRAEKKKSRIHIFRGQHFCGSQ